MGNKKTSVALVTGASRRLGYALAQTLQQGDYQVFAQYRTRTREVEQLGAMGVTLLAADLTVREQVSGLIETVHARTSRLDLMIHNASCFATSAPEPDGYPDQFTSFFQLHMLAPAWLNERLRDLLSHDPGHPGNIIHITDIYALRPDPAHHLYCATKAGLSNLTQSCARRYAPHIRVNEIAPGPILFAEEHDEAHREKVLAQTPLGCEGGLTPVLKAVDYLIDNPYVTGERIKVDGGRSLT